MTDYHKRRILREASEGKLSAAGIVKALQLNLTPRCVRYVLKEAGFLSYKRLARTPAMRERHEKTRLNWAMEKMTWSKEKWNTIVWSDEKKVNLDGPDGLAFKWHDLRKEKQWFSKRHSGGQSLTVWACFAGTKLSNLVLLEGKQDSPKYVKTLEEHLVPFGDDIPITWTFMQDGTPCHPSLLAKEWLEDQHIRVLEWPAYSPDLNPNGDPSVDGRLVGERSQLQVDRTKRTLSRFGEMAKLRRCACSLYLKCNVVE